MSRARTLLACGAIAAILFARLVVGCVGDDSSGATATEDGGGGDVSTPATKICNGVTVPTNDPATGCAATDCNPCQTGANQTATCDSSGKCATKCSAGFDDCDPSASGCETPTTTDSKNCGACKHVCGTNANTSSATCAAGKCVFTCVDPYAHCGTDDSLGCETNVGVDQNHCAACGHSCQGGDCVSGKCQAVLIAGNPTAYTGLKSLYGITVSGTQLFGTDWYQESSGLVYKLPTAGLGDGGAVSFLVKAPVSTDGGVGGYPDGGSAACSASPIVNDGTGKILYGIFRQDAVGPAPGIWEISTTGTNNRSIVTLPNGENISAIAADATYVYFSEFYRFGGANKTGIFRADRSTGANLTRFFFDVSGKGEIDSIYSEGGSIYFGDNKTNKIYAASPTTLDTPVELVTTVDPPRRVQTDATYVYYFDNNKFWRVKKVGTPVPEDITPTPGLPGSIVALFLVDDTFIYFFSPDATDLNANNNQKLYAFRKGAKSTDPPIVLAIIGSDNVSAITEDATTIYWTTYGRDTPPSPPPYSAIYKVAKPVK